MVEIYPKHKVTFKWVKGHAGNKYNEVCDQLAVAAANSKKLLIDESYEEAQKKEDGMF